MKKSFMFAGLGALLVTGAWAAYQDTEVVDTTTTVNTPSGVYTIQQIQEMNNDANVVLQGRVIGRIADEQYTFQDANGDTITVDIEDDTWRNQTVGSGDVVQIYGEIDRTPTGVIQIDVETIQKM